MIVISIIVPLIKITNALLAECTNKRHCVEMPDGNTFVLKILTNASLRNSPCYCPGKSVADFRPPHVKHRWKQDYSATMLRTPTSASRVSRTSDPAAAPTITMPIAPSAMLSKTSCVWSRPSTIIRSSCVFLAFLFRYNSNIGLFTICIFYIVRTYISIVMLRNRA